MATPKVEPPRKILVKDLNDHLTCSLCGGYYIDATTVVDCCHTFCRACIVRHFESSRLCPNCGLLVHKSKPLTKLRSDPILQSMIYKMVPALYNKEIQRRADFYHSTGFRANSSCSDDSVLGDRSVDSEDWVMSNVGDPSLYFSPDDSISLSVEYYRPDLELESSDGSEKCLKLKSNADLFIDSELKFLDKDLAKNDNSTEKSASKPNNENSDLSSTIKDVLNSCAEAKTTEPVLKTNNSDNNNSVNASNPQEKEINPKRYLQCPAAVRMSHLMKFLRMKFALSNEHRVDIIYAGEVLPAYLSLMDVAYTFKWKREAPMRFFYLIYIPAVRPVLPPQQPQPEVAPTTDATPEISDTAGDTDTAPVVPTIPPLKIEIPNIKNDLLNIKNNSDEKVDKIEKNIFGSSKKHRESKNEDNNNFKINKTVKFALEAIDKSEKELLRSQQKLTSKLESVNKAIAYEYKIKNSDSLQSSSNSDNCVYDYTEPDKDEIKAFAERRDREWALQKYTDSQVHVSKKRKKSKHSKNEFNVHKKRKLHAEITSNNEFSSKSDDSLKLKVKLSVANGHKHKHRSSSNSNQEKSKSPELSPKERLLQMRQVRHKTVTNSVVETEKKSDKHEPPIKLTLTNIADCKNEPLSQTQPLEIPEKVQKPPPAENRANDMLTSGKTLRSDFSFKTSISKDICDKFVRVNLEKCVEGNKNNGAKKPPANSSPKIEKQEKTEIFPVEKTNGNNKLNISNPKNETVKPNNNKPSVNNLPNCRVHLKQENFKTTEVTKPEGKETKNSVVNNKISSLTINETKLNIKLMNKPNSNATLPVDKSPQIKQEPRKSVSKADVINKPLIDESKSIENKLNNIDFKNNSGTLVTKNFTVSKVETGVKRKLEVPETQDKRPSLEITVINLVSRSPQTATVQTKPVTTNSIASPHSSNSKPSLSITPEGPPSKKIRPPPLTIPLGRIQKVGMKANAQKQSEKCDIFGALDLSAKPNVASGAKGTKNKDPVLAKPQGSKTNEPNKTGDKVQRPNISNLQLLSESAVQIREMMVKNSPIPTLPSLIKKVAVGGPQMGTKTAEFLQMAQNYPGARPPNLITKNLNPQLAKNNLNIKNPQFIPKNLQNLPKLNEINKSHFSRLNTTQQVRAPRPAGQNQTVRNIPNPSLLVRQQNQNRINSMSSVATANIDHSLTDATGKTKQQTSAPAVPEAVEKTAGKTSEPPPLKPIESFKK